MTIRETMEAKLQEHGLWPDEATAIMNAVELEETQDSMKHRWSDDADGYPPQLLVVVWIMVKASAAKWLEENKPMHWAKALFV